MTPRRRPGNGTSTASGRRTRRVLRLTRTPSASRRDRSTRPRRGRTEGTMDRLRILLSGMVAADPGQGGATWAVLQYVLGLRRLGHHVTLVEPVPRASLRPAGAGLRDSENAAYFREVVGEFGL